MIQKYVDDAEQKYLNRGLREEYTGVTLSKLNSFMLMNMSKFSPELLAILCRK